MAEVNLLDRYPDVIRPIEERGRQKTKEGMSDIAGVIERDNTDILLEHRLLDTVRKFGKEYFDGDRLYGYGGYYYHPRFWSETVKRFRDYYKLSDKACLLDVGCAKGFMLYDFKKLMPNITIAGLDISRYAYDNALKEVKPSITVGSAVSLPYEDNKFDLVISINTVDHLPFTECKKALAEIERVSRKAAFISVNAWRTEEERAFQAKWNLTAITCMHADEWIKVFKDAGYTGDYRWFIPE